jgi:hypothetical protein
MTRKSDKHDSSTGILLLNRSGYRIIDATLLNRHIHLYLTKRGNWLSSATIDLTGELSGKIVPEHPRCSQVDVHALEAQFRLNVVNDHTHRHVSHEIGRVKFVVEAIRLDGLRLFFHIEVFIYFRSRSRTSLCEMTPGLVKL